MATTSTKTTSTKTTKAKTDNKKKEGHIVTIKDKNGNDIKAYDLIMSRNNCLAILSGAKTIEFRAFKDFFLRMFLTPTSYKGLNKDDVPLKLRDDINTVHFHDYGKTFYLDATIQAVDLLALHPDNKAYFEERYCNEMDEIIAKAAGKDHHDEDVEWAFCMPIIGYISKGGSLADVPTILPQDTRETIEGEICDFGGDFGY